MMRIDGIAQGFKASVLALIVAAVLAVGLSMTAVATERAYAAEGDFEGDISYIGVVGNGEMNYISGDTYDPTNVQVEIVYWIGLSRYTAVVDYADFDYYNLKLSVAEGTELSTSSNNRWISVYVDNLVNLPAAHLGKLSVVAKDMYDGIAILTQPETNYVEGDSFDASGLSVKLSYPNGCADAIDFADFTEYGVVLSPSDGATLTTDNNSYMVASNAIEGVYTTDDLWVVAKNAIDYIDITTWPTTSTYVVGQDFDPTGLVVTVGYFADSASPVYFDVAYEDFAEYGLELMYDSTVGEFIVSNYNGMLDDFETVNLIALDKFTGIAIVEEVEVSSYVEGQAFDPAGLVVELTYENGYSIQVAAAYFSEYGVSLSPESGAVLTLDNHDYTVESYLITNIGDSRALEVVAREIGYIEILEGPTKTEYVEGDAFDASGLKVWIIYNDGMEVMIEDPSELAEYGIVLSPADGDILCTDITNYTLTVGDLTVSGTLSVDEQVLPGDSSDDSDKPQYKLASTGDSDMAVVGFAGMLAACVSAAVMFFARMRTS